MRNAAEPLTAPRVCDGVCPEKSRRGVLQYMVLALCLALGFGCKREPGEVSQPLPKPSKDASPIVGAWRSPPDEHDVIKTEWGPVRMKVCFYESGKVIGETVFLKSPASEGWTLRHEKEYSLKGDRLRSRLFHRKKAVRVEFKEGRLIMHIPDSYTRVFVRTEWEPGPPTDNNGEKTK